MGTKHWENILSVLSLPADLTPFSAGCVVKGIITESRFTSKVIYNKVIGKANMYFHYQQPALYYFTSDFSWITALFSNVRLVNMEVGCHKSSHHKLIVMVGFTSMCVVSKLGRNSVWEEGTLKPFYKNFWKESFWKMDIMTVVINGNIVWALHDSWQENGSVRFEWWFKTIGLCWQTRMSAFEH